jgi:putative heme-binding domain-containing protein
MFREVEVTMRRIEFSGWIVPALMMAASVFGAWRSADGDGPAWVTANHPLDSFPIEAGDHICLVGNTLADRMQHDGWLETALLHRFADRELVIRNLGFSGDELNLRLRSQDFGSPDQHLEFNHADVILAFFGYNESYAGEAGLDEFSRQLGEQISHWQSQKYNGKSTPRIAICSPIAHEDLGDPNYSDGRENDARLELYTSAMRRVAEQRGVAFVDLFHPTARRYRESSEPLTINGIHLNDLGNRLVAGEIERALFGDSRLEKDHAQLASLRNAVLEKNLYWFNRYRATDGYSTFGGRADLAFVNGQTNRDVMQRELKILDELTANRDRKLWAVAQGKSIVVDDANTDAPLPVISNKPGAGPGGVHIALNEKESLEKMTVAGGYRVELFASEVEFPELVNPVQMSFDSKGRLWVATWATYPHWTPKTEMNDRLLILEDTDGDGRADKCQTFAGGLHNPTGFEFYNGGVLVANAPDLLFLKDTNGDDTADVRERILHGLDSADTHHAANSFVFDPGGALYFQEGTFHHTQVETPYGPPVRSANAAVYRYEPRTSKFEVYVPFGFANPHGHVFDRWGQDIVHDGTGSDPYHGSLFSGYLDFPQKHPAPPKVYERRWRPCPGTEIVSSRHFPPEMQGNLLVGNVIGFQGLLRYRIEDDGASFKGTESEPLVSSTDESFRPVDFEIAPDGSLYFIDWYNPIIGHMQHNLRDPSRDHSHGRVYRMTSLSRPLLKPLPIAGEPIDRLLELLKEPEDRVRYRAKIELGGRDTAAVISAARSWVKGLDPSDPEFEHHRLEALWVHQYHNVVDTELLDQVLQSPDFRARAAAVRVLCAWRDRIPDTLARLTRLAGDSAPRVRLEAVRAASYLRRSSAVDVALIAAGQPTDRFLEYVIRETIRGLKPHWRSAILAGEPLGLSKPESIAALLKHLDTVDLIKAPGERAVYAELLFRPGIPDAQRKRAMDGLAGAAGQPTIGALLDAIDQIDRGAVAVDETVIFDLVRFIAEQPREESLRVRESLAKLARSASRPIVRQIGFVALIAADGNVRPAWDMARGSVSSLADVVAAMPLIADPNLKADLYAPVRALVTDFPTELSAGIDRSAGTAGRYVRIELSGKERVLTLAEVEINSGETNAARGGSATQKNTAYDAGPERAIDGNTAGGFEAGGQTHSRDPTDDPWWEVDLLKTCPIDSIVVFNRTDGEFGKRLEGFTLKILDDRRNVVAELGPLAAPASRGVYPFRARDPVTTLRHAAMSALTSVRGQEPETIGLLRDLLRAGDDRGAALSALQKIPVNLWPAELAAPIIGDVVGFIESVPESDRTRTDVLDAIQLADAATALLPMEDAARIRRLLGQLGVRVIRVATVPHRMIFDQETIVVQADKPVELIFENNDLMPHNLVITEQGAMSEVGRLAESTATDSDAAARNYVPESSRILQASPLLQPGQIRKMSFRAPAKTGVYPVVCTYPGHWRTMFAALYVVDDLDEYLANPDAYLAKHSVVAKDEMLKNRRPRTAWTLVDLEPRIRDLANPSFDNGRRMFQVANCIGCHRLDGQGTQFGADLSKLDPKWTTTEILRAVVEPSQEINQDYQTYRFLMIDGKSHAGLIVAETENTVKIVENPLLKVEPLELSKDDIEERTRATKSVMPDGLLDRLSEHEVMDLIAFVLTRGQRDHELYRRGTAH